MNKSLLSDSIHSLIDYTHTFYCTAIVDNGGLEEAANFLLQGTRICLTGFRGRQVTLFENKYRLDQETPHIQFPDDLFFYDSRGFIGLVIIIGTLVGMILKLVAWVAVPGVFEKNRIFVHLQREELKKYRHWSLNCKLFNEILSKNPYLIVNLKNSTSNALQPFNLSGPVLEGIAYSLRNEDGEKGKYHLATFGLVSKACFLAAYSIQKQSQSTCLTKINRIFPSILLNWIQTIQPLVECPEMRLPAHRVSDNLNDLTIQKYCCTNNQNTNFLSIKDMQPYPIKWGENPVPFIAIQVHYSQPDQRFILGFFTRLAKQCKLRKDDLKRHHQVILIYQNASEEMYDQWAFKFPWIEEKINCKVLKEKPAFFKPAPPAIKEFLNLTKNDFKEEGLILVPGHSLLNQ